MDAPDARTPRATVDTNQFVSALISRGASHLLLEAWRGGVFILVLSVSVVEEICRVLRRPYFRNTYGLTEGEIRILEERIYNAAELIDQLHGLPEGIMVRDPKDQAVLQTAVSGNSDFLVTGDDDLLSLAGHAALGKLQIVTVNDFLARLGH